MYFYNKETKETTWTKPLKMCSPEELQERLRKHDETTRFFMDMEDRIHQKINRADDGDDTDYRVLPLDELPGLGADDKHSSGNVRYRPRTISSLDGRFLHSSLLAFSSIANLYLPSYSPITR
jgi:hypothetical protein